MNRHPTLAELRQKAHKQHHRTIGNLLARHYGRPLAIYGTWLAVRLGFSAHQVTVLALLASIAASALLATGNRIGFIGAVGLLHLAFWLDHVDGQVARWRGTAGLDGVYLDYLMHHVQSLVLGFGLGLGLARQTGQLGWTIAGFCAGCGWLFLSLSNDCRYKACFQRLKASGATYLVKGGSAERPAAPPGWPRRGIGMLSWPAFKACEPHVVLASLTVLAALACVDSILAHTLCRVYALMMAAAAPSLACLRIARSIRKATTQQLFDAWFPPASGPDVGVEAGGPSRPRPHVALRSEPERGSHDCLDGSRMD